MAVHHSLYRPDHRRRRLRHPARRLLAQLPRSPRPLPPPPPDRLKLRPLAPARPPLPALRHERPIANRQLRDGGMSAKNIKVRLRQGSLRMTSARGVYRVAGAERNWRQDLWIALLAGPDGTLASHVSAAALREAALAPYATGAEPGSVGAAHLLRRICDWGLPMPLCEYEVSMSVDSGSLRSRGSGGASSGPTASTPVPHPLGSSISSARS